MVSSTLRRVGGSVMLAIPPVFLEQLSLSASDSVAIAIEGGRLIVEPREKLRRHGLADLLAQCDPSAPLPEADDGWTAGGPAGAEIV